MGGVFVVVPRHVNAMTHNEGFALLRGYRKPRQSLTRREKHPYLYGFPERGFHEMNRVL